MLWTENWRGPTPEAAAQAQSHTGISVAAVLHANGLRLTATRSNGFDEPWMDIEVDVGIKILVVPKISSRCWFILSRWVARNFGRRKDRPKAVPVPMQVWLHTPDNDLN